MRNGIPSPDFASAVRALLSRAYRPYRRGLLGIIVSSFALMIFSKAAALAAESEWVHAGADGKLVYKRTSHGDCIMDFSYAGYMGGGVSLPTVPVKVTVKPTGGPDDTASIQAALDQVSGLPLIEGFRGAVLLAPGTYHCQGTLTIASDGVVLRGTGSSSGATQSTLLLSGKPHLAIAVRAPTGPSGRASVDDEEVGREPEHSFKSTTRTTISDTYVPSGARSFNVVNSAGFAAGDTIMIWRPATAAWIKLMGMDHLVREGHLQTWLKVGAETITERRVASVKGNQLNLDVPLSDSFDSTYLNPPGTSVTKVPPPTRVHQVGIEYLHIQSPPQEINHTEAHFTALRLNGQDCWARDVIIDETMNSVAVGGRRITLERVAVNRKARHQGASKPAEFAPNASEVLLDRCSVDADNVWFVATGAGQAGPIVVLNGTFHGNGRAESHQRWSTGMLYDNCTAPGGSIEVRDPGGDGLGPWLADGVGCDLELPRAFLSRAKPARFRQLDHWQHRKE